MGKASRNKQLKRVEAKALKKYGNIKMSEALLMLCEPYKIDNIAKAQYERLIHLSAAAWNMAIFPESARKQKFLELARQGPELQDVSESELILLMNNLTNDADDHLVMLTMLAGMMSRKLQLFPKDDRIVKKLWFEQRGQSNTLQVESIIPDITGQGSHFSEFLA